MDINEIASKQIYELKPLEMVSAKDLGVGQGWSILRVPGGWLFLFLDSTCFVPLNNEFEQSGIAGQKAAPVKKKNFRKKKKSTNG